MPRVLSLTLCPNCGAPVNVPQGTLHVICVYCNHSLSVTLNPGAHASLKPEGLAVADVERVKSLILDGEREEAIKHYQQVSAIPRSEAEDAIDAMVIQSHSELSRHLPLNARGIFVSIAVILGLIGFGALCVFLVPYASIFKIVLAAPIVLVVMRTIVLVRHVSATWTSAFGAKGNAKVLRCGVLRQVDLDATLAVCLFEVTPDDGSEPFQDQETVFVGDETLNKLVPGNVIRVRYDSGRNHVYMRAPVHVLAAGA